MGIDSEDLYPVLIRIKEKCGIDFFQYREPTLRRRLRRRLIVRNYTDIASYVTCLDSDPGEYKLLLHDLTIKYTEFSRDDWVFDIVQQEILPALFSQAPEGSHISIWSAGCATGEEVYTLAGAARQFMDSASTSIDVEILGTDIDADAIETARAGTYLKDRLIKPVNATCLSCFHDDGRRITATSAVKQLVQFKIHDLTAEDAEQQIQACHPEPFDLILCRNVLIYFKRPAQNRIQKMFTDIFRPGGYLVLGTGEAISREIESSFITVNRRGRVYRKR